MPSAKNAIMIEAQALSVDEFTIVSKEVSLHYLRVALYSKSMTILQMPICAKDTIMI